MFRFLSLVCPVLAPSDPSQCPQCFVWPIDFFNWKFQGDWSFDPEFWPDPASMVQKVKELTGAEMMVSLWPSVEDLSVNYIEMQERGLLATTRDGTGVTDSFDGVYTRLVDSTNPEGREFLCK
jgi:alpha-D-xyloside xylohydrolase